MMIKAIAYDMDGMLFHEPHFYTEQLEQEFGIPLEEAAFHLDPNYNRCKKGEISFEKFFRPYYEKWRNHAAYQFDYDQAYEHWFSFAKLDSEVVALARRLAELGIANYILTDNVRKRAEYLVREHDLSDTFTLTGSFNLEMTKDEEGYYSKFLEEHKLQAEKVMIFDDKLARIDMLREQGFKAYVYEEFSDFEKALKAEGVDFTD